MGLADRLRAHCQRTPQMEPEPVMLMVHIRPHPSRLDAVLLRVPHANGDGGSEFEVSNDAVGYTIEKRSLAGRESAKTEEDETSEALRELLTRLVQRSPSARKVVLQALAEMS